MIQDGNDAENLLAEIAKLMGLSGENPFKVRAFEAASKTLAGFGANYSLTQP